MFNPLPQVESGVHPTAVVGKNVRLAEGVAIMAQVFIGDDVSIDAAAIASLLDTAAAFFAA